MSIWPAALFAIVVLLFGGGVTTEEPEEAARSASAVRAPLAIVDKVFVW